jgi:hypothetical protein
MAASSRDPYAAAVEAAAVKVTMSTTATHCLGVHPPGVSRRTADRIL